MLSSNRGILLYWVVYAFMSWESSTSALSLILHFEMRSLLLLVALLSLSCRLIGQGLVHLANRRVGLA